MAKAVKNANAAAAAAAKEQKLGFLGEGPWAHVKEGDAHHPNGGGGDYFGRESKLKKDGGEDGQGGIVVDRWMWDAASGVRRPPCRAKCDRPEGCGGYDAYTDGDCDEILLRDFDADKNVTQVPPPPAGLAPSCAGRRTTHARAGRCLWPLSGLSRCLF